MILSLVSISVDVYYSGMWVVANNLYCLYIVLNKYKLFDISYEVYMYVSGIKSALYIITMLLCVWVVATELYIYIGYISLNKCLTFHEVG